MAEFDTYILEHLDKVSTELNDKALKASYTKNQTRMSTRTKGNTIILKESNILPASYKYFTPAKRIATATKRGRYKKAIQILNRIINMIIFFENLNP